MHGVDVGWQVAGYRHVRELGCGASGTVVLAIPDELTGAPVAIKYLEPALVADAAFRAGFRAEARLLGTIDDPHVVRLIDFTETAVGAAIVMELVDGASLRELLRQHGPTEPEAALVTLHGSLLGLGAAHALGIVHRDYKPENVLVTADGQSVLTDFGIAARAGTGGATSGTPEYMAPEQWRGGPASAATDVYAATVTFAECLAGRPPFAADDLAALRRQHERAPIPVDGLPEAVRPLVERGMAKDPVRRPSGTAEFLTELDAAATAGYGPDWEERGRAQLARRAALLALLFPLAGGVVGGTAIASTVLGGPRPGVRDRRRGWALAGAGAVLALVGGAIVVVSSLPPTVVATQASAASPAGSSGAATGPRAADPVTAGSGARPADAGTAAVPGRRGSGDAGSAEGRTGSGAADAAADNAAENAIDSADDSADDTAAAGEGGGDGGSADADDAAAGEPSGTGGSGSPAPAQPPSTGGTGLGQGSGTDGNAGNGGAVPPPSTGGTGLGQGSGTDGNAGNGGALSPPSTGGTDTCPGTGGAATGGGTTVTQEELEELGLGGGLGEGTSDGTGGAVRPTCPPLSPSQHGTGGTDGTGNSGGSDGTSSTDGTTSSPGSSSSGSATDGTDATSDGGGSDATDGTGGTGGVSGSGGTDGAGGSTEDGSGAPTGPTAVDLSQLGNPGDLIELMN